MSLRKLLRVSIVIAAVIVVIGPAWAGGSDVPTKHLSPPSTYPSGKLGEMVKLGKELMDNTNTHPLTKAYVGNSLTCSSCHLKAGTDPRAGTFIAVANNYPAYSPREKTVVTLQDRILNCFMRSMNGIRPPVGGEAAVAMTAYITWLSEGYTIKMNPVKPVADPNLPFPDPALKPFIQKADLNRGRQTYNNKCAGCHGADGQGVATFPPLWGDSSYNAGAGLSNPWKLATWLKRSMPLGNPNLTGQEAADIAAYVDMHPRPRFVLKDHLPSADQMGVYNSKVLNEVKEIQPLR